MLDHALWQVQITVFCGLNTNLHTYIHTYTFFLSNTVVLLIHWANCDTLMTPAPNDIKQYVFPPINRTLKIDVLDQLVISPFHSVYNLMYFGERGSFLNFRLAVMATSLTHWPLITSDMVS